MDKIKATRGGIVPIMAASCFGMLGNERPFTTKPMNGKSGIK
jgi:hypothetical protein